MNIGSVSRYVFWMALSSVAAVMLSGKQMPTEDDATFVYAIFGAFCGWLMASAFARRSSIGGSPTDSPAQPPEPSAPARINQDWPSIVGRYSDAATTDQAVLGVAALARHIEETSLSSGLFGWTSMFDLCIAQTAMSYPYAGPHLRVSPLSEGLIEFRYVDTAIAPKQWKRTVHATEAIARLHGFLAQLNWVARSR